MLPQRWCAKNSNLAQVLCQIRLLLFSRFLCYPVSYILKFCDHKQNLEGGNEIESPKSILLCLYELMQKTNFKINKLIGLFGPKLLKKSNI